jgi:c-di-GMP-related signal transduction protein
VGRVSVGRQPIFDRSLGVLGFELLYRASSEASSATDNGDAATAQVMVSTYTELGLERLVGERMTFLNVTRSFLTGDMPLPVPPKDVVLEILPTVEVDEAVLAGARQRRDDGFWLALDDFQPDDPREALLPLVDLVKVDITRIAPADLHALVERLQGTHVRLAAMRVEGLEDMSRGLELGFDYFQGYHLVRPDVVTAQVVTPSQDSCSELLDRLDAGNTVIEDVLRTDVALSYRLLRALQATSADAASVVSSLPEAAEALGPDRLRAWLQLLRVAEVDRPTEGQLSAALTRARGVELLAEAFPLVPPPAAFLAGLVSALHNVLGISTEEIVRRLPLEPFVADAVLSQTGPLGAMLNAVVAQESGEDIELDLGGERLDAFALSRIHLEAVGWSLQVCEQQASGEGDGSDVDIADDSFTGQLPLSS